MMCLYVYQSAPYILLPSLSLYSQLLRFKQRVSAWHLGLFVFINFNKLKKNLTTQ